LPDLLCCLQNGQSPYMGALVGRVANRIAGAQFTLDGETYKLAANNGPNCLHGAAAAVGGWLWVVTRTVRRCA
jgi:aldose 1-epimerase